MKITPTHYLGFVLATLAILLLPFTAQMQTRPPAGGGSTSTNAATTNFNVLSANYAIVSNMLNVTCITTPVGGPGSTFNHDVVFNYSAAFNEEVFLSGLTYVNPADANTLLRVDEAQVIASAVTGNGISWDGVTLAVDGAVTNGLRADVLNLQGATNGLGATGPQEMVNLVALGDSHTFTGGSYTNSWPSDSWAHQAALFSGGYIRLLRNAGISGEDSTQILSRVELQVAPLKPTHCVITSGANDRGGGWHPAIAASNLAMMVRTLLSYKITPILTTIVPAVGNEAWNARYNPYVYEVGRQYGVKVVDFYGATVASNTGAIKAIYQANSTHLNTLGHRACAEALLETLGLAGRGFASLNWTYFSDGTNNLATNGTFIASAGWVFAKTNSANNQWVLTPDADIYGNWSEIQKPSASGYSFLTSSIPTTTWSGSETLNVSCRIWNEVAAGSGIVEFGIETQGTIGDTNHFARLLVADTNDYPKTCVLNYDFVIPAGTTNLVPYLGITSGSGTCRIAQLQIRNITRLFAGLPPNTNIATRTPLLFTNQTGFKSTAGTNVNWGGGQIGFDVDNLYDIGYDTSHRPRTIRVANAVTAGGTVTAGSTAGLGFATRSLFLSPGDGTITAASSVSGPNTFMTDAYISTRSNKLATTVVTLVANGWTNNTGCNVFVALSGGAIQGVGVNNSLWSEAVTNDFVCVPLQTNEWVTVTNTAAPTVRWKPY